MFTCNKVEPLTISGIQPAVVGCHLRRGNLGRICPSGLLLRLSPHSCRVWGVESGEPHLNGIFLCFVCFDWPEEAALLTQCTWKVGMFVDTGDHGAFAFDNYWYLLDGIRVKSRFIGNLKKEQNWRNG